MPLDPDPQIYTPNDVDSSLSADKSATFFTKYIFWNYNDNDANDDDEDDEVSLEDATIDELNRALAVKEVEDEKDINKVRMQSACPPPSKLVDEQFPRILFLGTSAAGSFPLRNSSGVLVHLS